MHIYGLKQYVFTSQYIGVGYPPQTSRATMKQRDSDAGLTVGLFALGSPTMCALLKRSQLRDGH